MSAADDKTPGNGPEMAGDERQAAEYAMGLLEGEALLATRGRIAREPAFAGLVAQWEKRLVPMLDDVEGLAPPPELWSRIASDIEDGAGESEVVSLHRRVVLWQRVAAGSAVAAMAALALLLVPLVQAPGPAPAQESTPLVASIPIADTPLRIGVTYIPGREELLSTTTNCGCCLPVKARRCNRWASSLRERRSAFRSRRRRPDRCMKVRRSCSARSRSVAHPTSPRPARWWPKGHC